MNLCECGHSPNTHTDGAADCADCNCPFYARDDYDEEL